MQPTVPRRMLEEALDTLVVYRKDALNWQNLIATLKLLFFCSILGGGVMIINILLQWKVV